MKSTIALLLGALAIALAMAAFLRGSEPGSSGGPEFRLLSEKLDDLATRVEANATSQQQLAGEIEILRAVLAAEGARSEASEAPAAPQPETQIQTQAQRRAAPRPAPTRQANADFDAEALVGAGFSQGEVDAYRAYVDEADMRRLRLRDQAEREGWLGTSRFLQERQALLAELERQGGEFGGELRDWALYTSGVPNRVRVSHVLTGSPAAAAGLQQGDVLLQYADSRVLRPGELRGLTSQGDAGAQTPVTVLRGGDEVRVYVPRGPLGVRLQPFRAEPAPPR